jgi:hypothetical protein
MDPLYLSTTTTTTMTFPRASPQFVQSLSSNAL